MRKFFKFDELETSYRREILGGVTTFVAMAYIIIVNPGILSEAGLPHGPGITATILAAVVGTLFMALLARRPFAVAPYMGENAFFAYTVCIAMGYSWQVALGAVFISGVIFMLITAFKIRSWLSKAIPNSLKQSFSVGIGLFIMFIGLNKTGLIQLGVESAPVRIGDLSSTGSLLAILCIVVTGILMVRKVAGALLIGIFITTVFGLVIGFIEVPSQIVSMPPSLEPVFLKLDLAGALKLDFLPIILVFFIMAFVDTMGTLIGLSARAKLLDDNHNLPEIEKPMMADAVATTAAGLLGTSTTGAFIESAAGIEAGAKSGFASLVTAVLFLLCLFLSPLFLTVPPQAYGAALVLVGFLMMRPAKDLPFDDFAELFPALATVIMMVFTYNIGFGITTGLVLYPIFKIIDGKADELNAGIWILFLISVLLFLVYPYERI